MEAACPIIIDFCDASAHSKRFSEATVDFTIGKGLPLAYFFQAGQKELVSYLLDKMEHKSDAIENLKEFITNGIYFIKRQYPVIVPQGQISSPKNHDHVDACFFLKFHL
jgi:hypothetical protein